MTQLYVLDTDHLSLLQRGNAAIKKRLLLISPKQIAITIISLEEQMRGWLAIINNSTSSEKRVAAYVRLRELFQDFATLPVLDYNKKADEIFQEFRQQKVRIGTQDLRIAAIVLVNNGILVTRNNVDFAKVADLEMEDWSIEI